MHPIPYLRGIGMVCGGGWRLVILASHCYPTQVRGMIEMARGQVWV